MKFINLTDTRFHICMLVCTCSALTIFSISETTGLGFMGATYAAMVMYIIYLPSSRRVVFDPLYLIAHSKWILLEEHVLGIELRNNYFRNIHLISTHCKRASQLVLTPKG